ncbi:MAG: tetratricopeptide repeat protein [candidate division WOR-3 bacterium]
MNDIEIKIKRKISQYIKVGNFRAALRELRAYRKILSFTPEYYEFLKGYLLLKAGDPEMARKTFKKLTDCYPGKSVYQFFAGISNLELANYEESLRYFHKAFELSPQSKEYKKNFGWALVMNGKKRGLKILKELFYSEPFQKDLSLKYIVALIKFGQRPLALWLSRLAYEKTGDPDFLELITSLEDEVHSKSMFLTKNEEKVLVLLSQRSGYNEELIEELTILFLSLKNYGYKRIVNPSVWAAALDLVGKILKGNKKVNIKSIENKYQVKYQQISKVLSKIFSGGIVDE